MGIFQDLCRKIFNRNSTEFNEEMKIINELKDTLKRFDTRYIADESNDLKIRKMVWYALEAIDKILKLRESDLKNVKKLEEKPNLHAMSKLLNKAGTLNDEVDILSEGRGVGNFSIWDNELRQFFRKLKIYGCVCLLVTIECNLEDIVGDELDCIDMKNELKLGKERSKEPFDSDVSTIKFSDDSELLND